MQRTRMYFIAIGGKIFTDPCVLKGRCPVFQYRMVSESVSQCLRLNVHNDQSEFVVHKYIKCAASLKRLARGQFTDTF